MTEIPRRAERPAQVRKAKTEADRSPPVPRVARMIALAHYIERAVESGLVESPADMARRLGITPARMTQVMNLLNLAPRIVEAILTGKAYTSERALRATVREPNWPCQKAIFTGHSREG